MQKINVEQGLQRKITLGYPDSEHEPLEMDFEPICKRFNLTSGLLLHWQAKPFGVRCWGVYDIAAHEYRPVHWDKLSFSIQKCQTLQLDETKHPGIKPTACLYYPKATMDESKPYLEISQ